MTRSVCSPTDVNGSWRLHRAAVVVAAGADGKLAARRRCAPSIRYSRYAGADDGGGVSQSEAPRRFNTVLIGSFAFAAVLLAVLGTYSVIAFSVASRVQEMAIRMALGCQRGAIIWLVLRSGARLATVGCVIGLGGAVAASGLLRSLLFGVSAFDPLVLSLAALGVLLLAVAASALPALRAASVDPMRALRSE